MIGGDCVQSIQRRLLQKYDYPPFSILEFTRIEAEDLFEVKVDIFYCDQCTAT